MALTYVLLGSTVLSGNQTTITFSSIPSTYTDLTLRVSARVDSASGSATVLVRFNSDSASNYSSTYLAGDGSSTYTSRASQTSYPLAVNGSTFTANTFASVELYLPTYTSTASKPLYSTSIIENNGTEGWLWSRAGLYRGTSAISSIVLTDNAAGNFISGSTFYLYGIKNS